MPDATPAQLEQREQDRALVRRLVAGDAGAWEEFCAAYGARIDLAVHRAGVSDGDFDDARGFVVEGLLAHACRRLDKWKGRASLATYLYTVAKRLAIDYQRSLPRYVFAGEEETLEVPDVAAEVEAENHALQARLRDAILECFFRMDGSTDREMILLRYYAGLQADEIARLSGKNRNAVDQALRRAHQDLRRVAERVHPELVEYLDEDRHAQ
jgi:RNA polymerase sigma factor (sigma-70 family)